MSHSRTLWTLEKLKRDTSASQAEGGGKFEMMSHAHKGLEIWVRFKVYCLQMALSRIIWNKPSFAKMTAPGIILTFPCISLVLLILHSPIGKEGRDITRLVAFGQEICPEKKPYSKKS